MRSLLSLLALATACAGAPSGQRPDGAPRSDGGARDSAPACVPACAGKQCGDDGCGGVCGACSPTELCSAAGVCAAAGSAPLVVDSAAGPHAIHPEIYGLAYASSATLQALKIPVNRWGGNSTSLYNWQLDVHNTGNDYYFENIADQGAGTYGQPGYSSSADEFVKTNRAAGADTLLTLPTIGWTPKDRVSTHPFTCGFRVDVYGAQQLTDPYDSQCGNGLSPSGAPLAPDPTHDAMAVTPSFMSPWLSHLTSTFGTAAAGGIRYYQLDNEMMLWSSTHRDVHPMPVTSDEVWATTSSYAPVIKAADPSAFVLGYTSWGVLDLFLSGLDSANNNRNDQAAHGGIPLAQWYLRQLAAYERANGTRLVDCLDLHYYPQGGDPLVNTRSLWDASYRDPSWVDSFLGEPVRLLPRLKEWISAEYPGTGVCVSEYSFHFGSESSPDASLVEADVLGLFGVFGVRLAAYWTTPTDGSGAPQPAYRAFQIFRNYDGAGARFGDVSIGAASALPKVALYAAADQASAPTRLTVVIINKDTAAVSTTLAVQSFVPGAPAQVWQVVNNAAPARQADAPFAGGRLALTLPASSITLLAIPR